jgi:hypothetical protein
MTLATGVPARGARVDRDIASEGGTQRMAGQAQKEQGDLAKWQKMKGILKEITECLTGVQETEVREGIRSKVMLAERVADAIYGHAASQDQRMIVKTIKEMDKKIDALVSKTGTQKTRTWAEVAATNATGMLPPAAQRTAIRVRLEEAQGKSPPELLEAVKPAIQGAYAVRQLRSGDVEVMVTDQQAKDRALNQKETVGCKVLRQDYPVEVLGVPLTTGIKHGKVVDNEEIIKAICAATRRTIPGININRIRWLHDAKGHEDRLKIGKKRGTVIMSLPTQALQYEAIRKGVVIGAEFFEARLYNHSLEMKQCFKCYGWGHTQTACGKQERCGECAGNHPTKECTKERVSCVNCGKGHRAWQKRLCGTFQVFLDETKRKRTELVMQTAAVRSMSTNNAQTVPQATFQVPAKRPRAQDTPEQTQGEKRGRGRPTNIEVAARERSQSRLHLITPQNPQRNNISTPVIVPSSFPSTSSSFPSTLSSFPPTPNSNPSEHHASASSIPSSFLGSFPSSIGSLGEEQERPQQTQPAQEPRNNGIEDTIMDTQYASDNDL